jgi:hypothetical protein
MRLPVVGPRLAGPFASAARKKSRPAQTPQWDPMGEVIGNLPFIKNVATGRESSNSSAIRDLLNLMWIPCSLGLIRELQSRLSDAAACASAETQRQAATHHVGANDGMQRRLDRSPDAMRIRR